MPSNTRPLLRLPAAIRLQVLSAQHPHKICLSTNGTFTKAFSLTSQLCKQGGSKNNKPVKSAQPQTRTPQARNLPKPPTAPRPSPHISAARNAPPPPPPAAMAPASTPIAAPRPTAMDWTSQSFPNQDKVLLYVAPNHTAFALTSIITGLIFVIGACSHAHWFLFTDPLAPEATPDTAPAGPAPPTPEKAYTPFSIRLAGAISVLVPAVFGAAFIIAPVRLIKSLMLIRRPAVNASGRPRGHAPWRLRIEIERLIPGAAPRVLEVNPALLAFDRNVPNMGQNILLTSHQVQDAKAFTSKYLDGRLERTPGSWFTRFNSGLVNMWPGMKRETKRMFMRDQMAYVRVKGKGNYKLDLQNCHLLDEGRALDMLVRTDPSAGAGESWRNFLQGIGILRPKQ